MLFPQNTNLRQSSRWRRIWIALLLHTAQSHLRCCTSASAKDFTCQIPWKSLQQHCANR